MVALAVLVGCNQNEAELPVEQVVGSEPKPRPTAKPRPTRQPKPNDAGAKPAPAPKPAKGEPEAGALPEPWEPTLADCYFLQGSIARAWPKADEAFEAAAGRWERWYVPGDSACAIRVLDVTKPRFDDWGRVGDILLNPADPEILDGYDCAGEHYLLIDVLTHELGYAYGLEWTGARGRAMSTPAFCTPVVPTAAEISAAKQ